MRNIRELNKLLKEGKKPVLNKPPSETAFVERRSGPADQRKIPTFIARDRRSGIADRRQNTSHLKNSRLRSKNKAKADAKAQHTRSM